MSWTCCTYDILSHAEWLAQQPDDGDAVPPDEEAWADTMPDID